MNLLEWIGDESRQAGKDVGGADADVVGLVVALRGAHAAARLVEVLEVSQDVCETSIESKESSKLTRSPRCSSTHSICFILQVSTFSVL